MDLNTESAELLRMADRFITKVDQLNKRLTTTISIIIITLSITIMFMVGAYFLSDYQYPEVSQEVTQQNDDQSQKSVQQIK